MAASGSAALHARVNPPPPPAATAPPPPGGNHGRPGQQPSLFHYRLWWPLVQGLGGVDWYVARGADCTVRPAETEVFTTERGERPGARLARTGVRPGQQVVRGGLPVGNLTPSPAHHSGCSRTAGCSLYPAWRAVGVAGWLGRAALAPRHHAGPPHQAWGAQGRALSRISLVALYSVP